MFPLRLPRLLLFRPPLRITPTLSSRPTMQSRSPILTSIYPSFARASSTDLMFLPKSEETEPDGALFSDVVWRDSARTLPLGSPSDDPVKPHLRSQTSTRPTSADEDSNEIPIDPRLKNPNLDWSTLAELDTHWLRNREAALRHGEGAKTGQLEEFNSFFDEDDQMVLSSPELAPSLQLSYPSLLPSTPPNQPYFSTAPLQILPYPYSTYPGDSAYGELSPYDEMDGGYTSDAFPWAGRGSPTGSPRRPSLYSCGSISPFMLHQPLTPQTPNPCLSRQRVSPYSTHALASSVSASPARSQASVSPSRVPKIREEPAASKKRKSAKETEGQLAEKKTQAPELTKSALQPPKPAQSTWQIYFTDYLRDHKAKYPLEKLNVAHVAKEAGNAYKALQGAELEALKKRAKTARDVHARDLAIWQSTLTPEDIRRENAFRTAQRRAGKSRRGNIKDPNAPAKPLSAYFMYLQKIRSDPAMVEDVFGGEMETTKQSILAAQKWRSLTDEERKPFLSRAEADKIEYAKRAQEYEDRHVVAQSKGTLSSAEATIMGQIGETTSEGEESGYNTEERA